MRSTASALCTQDRVYISINVFLLTRLSGVLVAAHANPAVLQFFLILFSPLLRLPVRSLPLVERCCASRAVLLPVLTAQPGGAGHVVIGHRGRLHRLQSLEGGVASKGTVGEVEF